MIRNCNLIGKVARVNKKIYTIPRSKMATLAALSNLSPQSSTFAPFFPTSPAHEKSKFEQDVTDYYLPFRFRLSDKAERYKLGNVLGSGYFATVYEGVDQQSIHQSMSKVAIKAIEKNKCPKELFSEELKVMRYIQRFTQSKPSKGDECLNFARDVFETKDRVYFVLDLCKGGDMFDYVASHKTLSENDAKIVLRRLLEGLDTLHQHDVVHRDVKLENLIMKDAGDLHSTKLTDFGYAKLLGDNDVFRNVAGTFGYVCPQALANREYSSKSDIWSTGVVLFTLLGGYQPFPYKPVDQIALEEGTGSKTMIDVELEAILHGRSDEVWSEELRTKAFIGLSSEAKELLSSLLEIDPAKRPSAREALASPWFQDMTSTIETQKNLLNADFSKEAKLAHA